MVKSNFIRVIILPFIVLISFSSGFCIIPRDTLGNRFIVDSPVIFKQNKEKLGVAKKILFDFKKNNSNLESVLPNVSMDEIIEDLDFMLNHPNSTRLNGIGNYCAVVVVLNWLLNNRPDIYTKAVLDLSKYGKASFANSQREIVIPKTLYKHVNYRYNDSITPYRTDLDSTSISDFIFGVSLLHSQKKIQKFGLIWKTATFNKESRGNFIYANTPPWEIDNYFKILGIDSVDKHFYLGCKKELKTLEKIEKSVESGLLPIIFENHLITATKSKNLLYHIVGAHFITIHEFEINEELGVISMSYWDYGMVSNKREIHPKDHPYSAKNFKQLIKKSNRYKEFEVHGKMKKITIDNFLEGFKGYWLVNSN